MARPVLDNHCHLDPEHGQGLEAVRAFARSGGTHLLVVNQPSWKLVGEVESAEAFRPVFETTIDVAAAASAVLPGRAWPVLGVHPALLSRLVDAGVALDAAADRMRAGLDVAAEYVGDGSAVALKSGRPHYEVPEAVWSASNAVLRHALALGARADVAVQLHTEATDDLTDVGAWADEAGLDPARVVKHYAGGPVEGVTPSVIGREDPLRAAAEAGGPFLMETDFLDDPDRPGAVLGLRTVPRRTEWLREAGHAAAVRRAHVETPRAVYGIDTTLG